MSAAVDRLRDALNAHDCATTDRGTARCPAHEDGKASLTFGVGEKGAVLHCHAGCTTAAVLEALGLKAADLFDDNGNGRRREVAAYDYTDEAGALLFQVVRFDPKDFRQRRPDGAGGWTWKLGDTRRALYRLPAIIEAVKAGRVIYIVEGEKDVATLVGWGLDATCNPGGAGRGKWKREYSDTLRGAHVVIIPDADKPGREHAAGIAAALAGVAAEVRTIELPGAKDATAWAAAGGTREALEALCTTNPGAGVLLSDVRPELVRWLWPGRIPLGKLTVVDGDPGQGKSTMMLDLAARVSRGRTMPDGAPGVRGGVVVLTAEDGLADTVRPRLEAAGADLSRIVALTSVPTADGPRPVTLPDDLDVVRAEITRVGAVLIVVDPLMAFLTGTADAHRDQDVRRALVPLVALAEETGVAIVLIRHLVKSGGTNPLYRGGGSIGIVGACRSGLLVMTDPESAEIRILTSTKSNLSAPPESLAYRLEAAADVVRVCWLGASAHTATSLLADGDQDGGAASEARSFLLDLLSDGPRPARDVKREVEAAGLSWRTIERAKSALGVVCCKAGFGGGWSWRLKTANPSNTAKEQNNGGLGGLGGLRGSSSSSYNGSSESTDEHRQDRHSPCAGGLREREPGEDDEPLPGGAS